MVMVCVGMCAVSFLGAIHFLRIAIASNGTITRPS